jgi:hypothetical protein
MNEERYELSAEERELVTRVRSAVRSEKAPPDLQVRIRARLEAEASRDSRRPSWFARPWIPVSAAAAICFAAALAYQLGHLRFTVGQQESFIASMLTKVSFPMKPGLDDHLHCSVYGRVPKNVPPLTDAVKKLPPQYRELLTVVQRNAPAPFRIYSAHECRRQGRTFVHFQLKTDSKLLSVIVTRRGVEESFVRDKIAPALAAEGTSIYEAKALRFQIAAIETRDHLAYVVSDLSSEQNVKLMLAMAPSVQRFLTTLES